MSSPGRGRAIVRRFGAAYDARLRRPDALRSSLRSANITPPCLPQLIFLILVGQAGLTRDALQYVPMVPMLDDIGSPHAQASRDPRSPPPMSRNMRVHCYLYQSWGCSPRVCSRHRGRPAARPPLRDTSRHHLYELMSRSKGHITHRGSDARGFDSPSWVSTGRRDRPFFLETL